MPSAGQDDMTVDNYSYAYYGKWIPRLDACFKPYGQEVAGEPKTDIILVIWSIYEFPKNKGLIIYISATMQPSAKISTGAE